MFISRAGFLRLATVAVVVGAAVCTPKSFAVPTEIPGAVQPQLATGGGNRVWLTYGKEGAAYVALSEDCGATFGPAKKLPTSAKLKFGMRRGPRIAAHGDRVTVTLMGEELLAFRSIDAGKTWSEAVPINDAPGSAREG